jgi:hypothetical protein
MPNRAQRHVPQRMEPRRVDDSGRIGVMGIASLDPSYGPRIRLRVE